MSYAVEFSNAAIENLERWARSVEVTSVGFIQDLAPHLPYRRALLATRVPSNHD